MREKLIVAVLVGIALLIAIPMAVNARTVESGGTIHAGEEHLYLAFVESTSCTKFGYWESAVYVHSTSPNTVIDLSNSYTDFTPAATIIPEWIPEGHMGWWRCLDSNTGIVNDSGPTFLFSNPYNPTPVPTTIPTPTPTPSEGNIIISSSPSDATVYVDNVIKGITPLTVTVKNGAHVVRIRLDGYQESKTSVTVTGEDISIKPVLIPVTTVATTYPTTIQTTVLTTTQITTPTTFITTKLTTIPTTAAINYSETIVAMQKKIDEQATKNAEQDVTIAEQSEQIGFLQQLIDSILGFLGLK